MPILLSLSQAKSPKDTFDEMPPRMWLRKRVKQYFEYFDDEMWQENTGHQFPKIIMITIDEKAKKYLYRFICKTMDDESGLEFYLSTRKLIKIKGLNSKSLTKVVREYF